MTQLESIQGLLIALFCGAFIGVEREFGKATEAKAGAPARRAENEREDSERIPNPAGIRTHVLTALLGGILQVLDGQFGGGVWFSILGLASTVLLTVSVYGVRAARTGQFGVTSSFTLVITYALGVLSLTPMRTLAAALAVAVTATLAMKAPLHRFISGLTREEIGAAIKLGLVAVVLLPLLPNRTLGPADWPALERTLLKLGVSAEMLNGLAVLNPFGLWFLVVAISAIGFVGYVLMRSLGAGRGLVLTGIVGGLVSSTAVTLSMAGQSKQSPNATRPIVAAVQSACGVMSIRIMVLVLALSPSLFLRVSLIMLPMLATYAVGAWWLGRSRGEPKTQESVIVLQTPFALVPALQLTASFFGIRILSAVLTILLGGAGLLMTALLSGLVDVDAITAAVSTESARSHPIVTFGLAAVAIFVAVVVNTVVKWGMLFVMGSRPVGRLAAGWMFASIAAGSVGLLASIAVFD